MSISYGGPIVLSIYAMIAGIVAAVIGLSMSITGMALNSKDPDKWGARGLSIAGMIISSIMAGLWLIASLIYFAFL